MLLACSADASDDAPHRADASSAASASNPAAPAASTRAQTTALDATTPDPSAPPSASADATSAAPNDVPACPTEMTLIDGGRLSTMERGRDVDVAAVCVDLREVTVKDFRSCVREGGCKRECEPGAACPDVPIETRWDNPDVDTDVSRFCNGREGGAIGRYDAGKPNAARDSESREGHPVNCVSFTEASAYCTLRGKRLPTGDEWEWASRGGAARAPSPWGTPIAKDEICWGKPKKRAGTCEEGSFAKDKTAHGLVDMGGNVSEWTTAPARSVDSELVRWAYGASWYAIDDGYARAALGGMQMPARRAETVGFRCAMTPTRR